MTFKKCQVYFELLFIFLSHLGQYSTAEVAAIVLGVIVGAELVIIITLLVKSSKKKPDKSEFDSDSSHDPKSDPDPKDNPVRIYDQVELDEGVGGDGGHSNPVYDDKINSDGD